jgi:t-SNARE complex subunit (syntaxin)
MYRKECEKELEARKTTQVEEIELENDPCVKASDSEFDLSKIKSNLEKLEADLNRIKTSEVSSDTIEANSSQLIKEFDQYTSNILSFQDHILLNKCGQFESKFQNIRDLMCQELMFNK